MADQTFRVKNGLEVGFGGTIITTTPDGLVGVGTTDPTQRLDIDGSLRVRGSVYDNNNNVGAAGSVLVSTGTGVKWDTSSPTGGVLPSGDTEKIFHISEVGIDTSYTIPSGYNALSVGPHTIGAGVTVTIPVGSTWIVIEPT